jgi:hypothetical protein
MVIRVAVSVVLICVSVLLLSACGISLLIPPRQPVVMSTSLVLWDVSQTSIPTQLGTLRLSGAANHIDADLVLKQPDCLKDQQLYLTGSVARAHTPELTLTQKPGQSEPLQLNAALPAQPIVYTVDVSPSSGSLSIGSGCAPARTFQFQARELPEVLGTWLGSAAPTPRDTIIERISSEPARRFDQPQATIEFRHNLCFHKGETTAAVELPSIPQHFTLAFKMDTGAILTADTTVDVLTRNTPLITHYSVHGGACDGQIFDATLRKQ